MIRNALIKDFRLDFVNEFRPISLNGICEKCQPAELQAALGLSSIELEELKERHIQALKKVPIVSAHSPADWNYKTIGIVTAQSVIGTGLMSEISSSISDLLGQESDRLNKKIRTGEDLCFERIRRRSTEIGGNAVLAVDIDYNEVGGMKGMIMVCATGTAVRLNPDRPDYWSSDYKKDIARIGHLSSVRHPFLSPGQ